MEEEEGVGKASLKGDDEIENQRLELEWIEIERIMWGRRGGGGDGKRNWGRNETKRECR